MKKPELADDARFATLKSRVAHMDLVDNLVAAWTHTFDKEELFKLLMKHRVPCAPVRDLGEVMNDPHLHARGALRRVDHPTLGEIVLSTGAMRFSDEPLELLPSKELGADNVAIYRDWLGLSETELDACGKEGVI
jgi:CoA:oxalate CoA-transferase